MSQRMPLPARNTALSEASPAAQLVALRARTELLAKLESDNAELLIKLESERQARKAADTERLKTVANAKVDEWQREGRLSGNATARVRSFYVKLVTGERVTTEDFANVLDALPRFHVSRIVESTAAPTVTREDFARAATHPEVSKRIAAAVTHRQKSNPNFTRENLRVEVEQLHRALEQKS